ncbi:MAG: M23 family metallopeptidase [Oscillospiraceae bacterium]|nr:M23 family metallopeptidase [Oscillospiraceae bacterium]
MGKKLSLKSHVLAGGSEWLNLTFGLQKNFWGPGQDYTHKGVDIIRDDKPTSSDTVIAPFAGTVTAVQTGYPNKGNMSLQGTGQYGNMVTLDAGGGFAVLVCHLATVAVKKGQAVKAGAALGTMGTSGYSSGLHLHLGISKSGVWIDPLPYLEGKATTAAAPAPAKPVAVTPAKVTAATAPTLKAGQAVKLSRCPLYVGATAKSASGSVTGTYYLWSADTVSGRVRVTNAAARVGKSGQVTGWVDVGAVK